MIRLRNLFVNLLKIKINTYYFSNITPFVMKQLLSIIFIFVLMTNVSSKNNQYQFLVGTYTSNTPSKGIYSLKLNKKTLSSDLKVVAEVVDPSFLAISKNKKQVFSVSERGDKCSVNAFKFNSVTSSTTFINKVSAGNDTGPCHIAATEKHVFIANYGGGSIFAYNIQDNNSLSEVVQQIQHTGMSVNPTRQTKPHVHQVVVSPDSKFLLVNDLGTDLLTVYSYDKNSLTQPLTAFDTLQLKKGSGPRHLTFDNTGNYIYLIQELDGTLSTIKYDFGRLTLVDTASVVIKKEIQTGAADIHVSPDGMFVYATNRGTANDISCFQTSKSGRLKFVQQISVEGVGPRNFAITKDGKYVLVGNQRTNEIVIFSRNKKTGELTFTGNKVQVGAPVCILEY
jgi:6-phosphogluconolactonase